MPVIPSSSSGHEAATTPLRRSSLRVVAIGGGAGGVPPPRWAPPPPPPPPPGFGTLCVAALAEITGDFAQAIKLSSQVLATRGHIYPATTTNVTLSARMDDGSIVEGETNITASHRRICELTLEPAGAEPLPETLESVAPPHLIPPRPRSLHPRLLTN